MISSLQGKKAGLTEGLCELDFERGRGVQQFRRDSNMKGMDVFMSRHVGAGEKGGEGKMH